MSVSNPAAWFAVCALCLLAGWAILRSSHFYRTQLAEAGASRFECIDGLRGFLALGVFGVHAVNMYTQHAYGEWATDLAPFYTDAAAAGVALFFMITGFLFWLRVLRAGRSFDTRAFFISRLRRLVPMWAMSVVMVLLVAAAATGFKLRLDPIELAREVRPWLSFGFMEEGGLNGFADAHYINRVYWTLAFEWGFYLALPLLALFARGWGFVALLAAAVFFGTQAPIVLNFVFGALAAALVHSRTLDAAPRIRWASPWLGLLALAALGGYFLLPKNYGLPHTILLFGFFIFIVQGNSLFGLLRTGPAKLLGLVSYSIYLTHCIALFVTVRAVEAVRPVETLHSVQFWLIAALAAAGCVLLSTLTYRYVEFPFLHPQARRQPSRAHSEAVS
jgi:peptidoglycan/LPS O-acetylase OafA/YrhL